MVNFLLKVVLCVDDPSGPRGGRTSSKKHVKKLHSILGYAESSRRFTEINKVSARSIQVCWGSMGFNACNTLFLRVEYPYIVRKLVEMGELTFHAEKAVCCRLQQETKVHI